MKSLSSPCGMAGGRLRNSFGERGWGSTAGHTASAGAKALAAGAAALLCVHQGFGAARSPQHPQPGHFSTHWDCNHSLGSMPRKAHCGQSPERCLQARGDWQPRAGDRHPRWPKQLSSPPALPGLTCFTTLPVLSELLKLSTWFLLSLTWFIMFAQPLCRLCAPGEHARRQRNSAGSVSVCLGAAAEAFLLVAPGHAFF